MTSTAMPLAWHEVAGLTRAEGMRCDRAESSSEAAVCETSKMLIAHHAVPRRCAAGLLGSKDRVGHIEYGLDGHATGMA